MSRLQHGINALALSPCGGWAACGGWGNTPELCKVGVGETGTSESLDLNLCEDTPEARYENPACSPVREIC